MRTYHWVAFGGAFVAAVSYAMDGEYGRAIWPLIVCVWVHMASTASRDAARYRYVRKTTTAVHDVDTKQQISVTPPELDEAIDRMMSR